MRGIRRRSLLPWVIVVLLSGCQRKPAAAPVVTVQCRVVIVLKAGDTVGNRSNVGCRLTEDEVRQYMEALNEFAPRYGRNVQFAYNDPPIVWVSPNLDVRPYDFADWVEKDMSLASGTRDPGLTDQAINIYFVGWIQFDDENDPNNPPPTNFNGNTVDPKDREGTLEVPHIFISDRGFPPPEGLGIGGVRLSDRVLEHEICHYLLRQRAAFGQGARYDNLEHAP